MQVYKENPLQVLEGTQYSLGNIYPNFCTAKLPHGFSSLEPSLVRNSMLWNPIEVNGTSTYEALSRGGQLVESKPGLVDTKSAYHLVAIG